jgi:hypothetical protein
VRPVKQRELAAATGGEVSELHGDHDCFWIDGERFAALTRSVALAVAAAGAPGRRRSERVLPTPAS